MKAVARMLLLAALATPAIGCSEGITPSMTVLPNAEEDVGEDAGAKRREVTSPMRPSDEAGILLDLVGEELHQVCTPGERACYENSPIECLPDGTGWSEGEPCPEGTECIGGECIEKVQVCTPGDVKCEGNGVSTCLPDGSGWGEAEPCPEGSVCQNGGCVVPQEKNCEEVLICMLNKSCGSPEPVCFEECFAGASAEAVWQAKEIYECVYSRCGKWGPGEPCFLMQRMSVCAPEFAACKGCVPNCQGKQCGSDGCGGECGTCPEGTECVFGVCVSKPAGWSCAQIIDCVKNECKFALQCSWKCYIKGSPSGQETFESLALCILEECGENASESCALQALDGECKEEYENCLEN